MARPTKRWALAYELKQNGRIIHNQKRRRREMEAGTSQAVEAPSKRQQWRNGKRNGAVLPGEGGVKRRWRVEVALSGAHIHHPREINILLKQKELRVKSSK